MKRLINFFSRFIPDKGPLIPICFAAKELSYNMRL